MRTNAALGLFLIGLSLLGAAISHGDEDIDGIGTYNEGYRMGFLKKVRSKGIFVESAEGELSLGYDSKPITDYWQCGAYNLCFVRRNPWKFSAENENAERFRSFEGKPVWIKYRVPVINNLLKYGSTNVVTEIQPINPALAPSSCASKSYSSTTPPNEVRMGRVVKVASQGLATKSDEIIVQLGFKGNDFQSMTSTDPEMSACLEKILKSGIPVQVSYSKTFEIMRVVPDYRTLFSSRIPVHSSVAPTSPTTTAL